jgi:hypothetical protein
MEKLEALKKIDQTTTNLNLKFKNGKGQIYFLTESILRFRFVFGSTLPPRYSLVIWDPPWSYPEIILPIPVESTGISFSFSSSINKCVL